MPIEIVEELCYCVVFPDLAVFHKSSCTLVDSFNIITMLFSIWVPHAVGVLQTRAEKGEVCLTFNTFFARIKITCDETKGVVSLPYNFLYM